MRIAHVITRMIVGGAQENTLLCCKDAVRLYGDETVLITGPSLGPEGDLLARQHRFSLFEHYYTDVCGHHQDWAGAIATRATGAAVHCGRCGVSRLAQSGRIASELAR